MPKFFDRLTPEHADFIRRQRLFFVATAPPGEGRINLSPKGMDSLRVLSDDTVAYLDLTGSGNETAAHLRHDPQQRITFMFCSFDQKPLILRLYARGEVVRPGDDAWPELVDRFPNLPGVRQLIVARIESGQTSCGFGVPMFDLRGERGLMESWALKKGPDGLAQYRREKNARSIDGLPTGF
jgi:hypothetical protein